MEGWSPAYEKRGERQRHTVKRPVVGNRTRTGKLHPYQATNTSAQTHRTERFTSPKNFTNNLHQPYTATAPR